jgi:hypothetical protein
VTSNGESGSTDPIVGNSANPLISAERSLLFVAIAAAVFPVLPHLGDLVWQDEAYTLLRFCTRGWMYPFTDYHLPNNHVLPSAGLSSWWKPGDSPAHIRVPLLIAYILSVLLLARTVMRRFGTVEAAAVLLVFASGSIVPAFALQLRAYGLSWLFVVIMLAAFIDYLGSSRRLAATVYSLAGSALLVCVPSNVVVIAVFVLAGSLYSLLMKESLVESLKRAAVLAFGPMLGTIAYIGIWRHVVAATGHAFGDWDRAQLLKEFFGTLLADRLVYLPLVGVGLFGAWRGVLQGQEDARMVAAMAVSVALVPVVFVIIAPAVPFPRTLVPLMPMVAFVLGLAVTRGIKMTPHVGASQLGLTVSLLVVAFAALLQQQLGYSDLARPGNLCRPYFQHEYQPEAVVNFVLQNSETKHRLILTNVEAFYALLFLDISYRLNLNLLHIDDYDKENTGTAPVLVTGGSETVDSVTERIGLDNVPYSVYAPP